MIRRSLREWDHIAFGTCDETIPDTHAARLVDVARRSPFSGRGGNGVLEHRRKDSNRTIGTACLTLARCCKIRV